MRAFLKRFVRHRPAVLGLVILLAVTAFALLAPAIHPASPFSLIGKPFQAPFGEYLFGTDQLGRDVLSRVPGGARDVLLTAPAVALLSVAGGTMLGLVAGYLRPDPYPRLVVERAPGHVAGMEYEIGEGAVLGRGDQAEIRLEDPFASSQHARLSVQGGMVVVEDLGSTNGTYLNEELLHGAQALHPGDRVRIGDSEFTYLDG